jgi:large subunit ribosomal protein L32
MPGGVCGVALAQDGHGAAWPDDLRIWAAPRRGPLLARHSPSIHRSFRSALEARRYTAPPMAVPKRKTSKSRRDRRRANHRISAPSLSTCPQCHQPVRPHHVCSNCGHYRGREVEPLTQEAP